MTRRQMTYTRAGVDISRVKQAHTVLAKKLQATFQTRRGKVGQPLIPIGHYGGLVDLGDGRALSLHVDGVGTKVMVAQMMRKYDTIGIDCVAMCTNDLICTGSEPIAFLDYIALSRPNTSIVTQIAEGIVKGAKEAGVAVVGGETAIVPDLLSKSEGGGVDLIGMAVGIGSKKKLILGDQISKGDILIGVASSGIHSNGLTLARKVLLRRHSVRDFVPELGRSIGEELLEPTRIYVKPVREAVRNAEIHGLAHITGGGLMKLSRVLARAKVGARIENLPPMPKIFQLIKKRGSISDHEMYRTFNMGIGLVLICPKDEAESVVSSFEKHHLEISEMGRVNNKPGVWVRKTRIR